MIVPRFPGSLTASKATINPLFSIKESLGISKTAKAVFGVFKALIFFSSASVISVSFSTLKVLVVNKSTNLNVEFKNSLITFTPSAINKPSCCLYFFCCKRVIFLI